MVHDGSYRPRKGRHLFVSEHPSTTNRVLRRSVFPFDVRTTQTTDLEVPTERSNEDKEWTPKTIYSAIEQRLVVFTNPPEHT